MNIFLNLLIFLTFNAPFKIHFIQIQLNFMHQKLVDLLQVVTAQSITTGFGSSGSITVVLGGIYHLAHLQRNGGSLGFYGCSLLPNNNLLIALLDEKPWCYIWYQRQSICGRGILCEWLTRSRNCWFVTPSPYQWMSTSQNPWFVNRCPLRFGCGLLCES